MVEFAYNKGMNLQYSACPKCEAKQLVAVKVDDFETQKQHIDGKLYRFQVKDLVLPKCNACQGMFMTTQAEKQVNKAFKQFLKDNRIKVTADQIIDASLAEVPEQDRKMVRDALCDMVFFRFNNLSFQQMRPFLQAVVAGDLPSFERLSPPEQQPYRQTYLQFLEWQMPPERTELAQKLWRESPWTTSNT